MELLQRAFKNDSPTLDEGGLLIVRKHCDLQMKVMKIILWNLAKSCVKKGGIHDIDTVILVHSVVQLGLCQHNMP
jgi:hypothetical protein